MKLSPPVGATGQSISFQVRRKQLDVEQHLRRPNRLRGYDYSQAGAYFVTIVAQDRVCLFGEVVDGVMCPSDAGRQVATAWNELPAHYPHVELDAFVVMPNHFHGVIMLTGSDANAGPAAGMEPCVGAGLKPALTTNARHGLPEILRAMKTFSGRHINAARNTPGAPVWQRSYYEHIIRDEPDLDRIRRYIDENPLRWETDEENPGRLPA